MTIVNTTGWPQNVIARYFSSANDAAEIPADLFQDRHMAHVIRRSAELFDAWLDKDPADVSALIAEIVESNDDPVDVMSSLLYVGGCLIRAAICGDIEETFDRLLSDAVAAEALT